MFTYFQKRKLKAMFTHMDQDKDGFLVATDYNRIRDNLLKVLAIPQSKPEYAEIIRDYDVEWDELVAGSVDAPKVSFERWFTYREAQLIAPNGFEINILPYVTHIVNYLDTDHDNRITMDDLRRYFSLYGMPSSSITGILEAINPTKLESFAKQDVVRLANEYYYSNDPNVYGNWLLGPF